MAVPSDPTLNSIITEALKRGGQRNPSATQITDATTHAVQEVKADIRHFASRHPLLKTTAVTYTTVGVSRYSQPSDVDAVETVVLLDGPDSWRGTATAGATQSITLASTLSEDTTTMQGKFLVLTGGTGAEQYRQITNWTNATKVASADSSWTTNPASGTTYLVVDNHIRLYDYSKAYEWDYLKAPYGLSTPRRASMVAETLYLDYAPDRIYGLLWTYWADLDRLDETGTLFIKLLREWRTVWVQGLAMYAAQRYDDERYPTLMAGYQIALSGLSTAACTVAQGRYCDV